jgi:hypothetical protein
LPESQHINELSLLIVDHPTSVQVIPGSDGKIYTIQEPLAPLSAVCFDGRDVLKEIRSVDGTFWESDLSFGDSTRSEQIRDGIVCCFPRSGNDADAKLVINTVNTFLGNFAVDRLFALQGPEKLHWIHRLNNDPLEMYKLLNWMIGEGGLEVWVEVDGEWRKQTSLLEVGPYVCAEKVIRLDLTGVRGDTIRLKLESAVDLWRIDRLAIDFSGDVEITVKTAQLDSAITESGVDVAASLLSTDDMYYSTLPDDYALTYFQATPLAENQLRSFLVRSRGYYYPWTSSEKNANPMLVNQVLTQPRLGNRLLLPLWREHKNQRSEEALMPVFDDSR